MRPRMFALPVIAFAATNLSACGVSDTSPELEVTASEITNGTDQTAALYLKYGLVAIFNSDFSILNGDWWPRPCSGKVITSAGGHSVILTARHCVTRDGSLDGQIGLPSDMRVIASRTPGLAPPPAGAVAPTTVVGYPIVASERLDYQDLAIITLDGPDLSANVASRQGFWLGDPVLLGGSRASTYAYGYGINVGWNGDEQLCTTLITTGAGRARRGGPYPILLGGFTPSRLARGYNYANSGSGVQSVICGDSGGPDVTTFGGGSFPWGVQLGVHSRGGPASLFASGINWWVDSNIGGVYVSPYSSATTNLRVLGNTISPVSSDSPASKLWYDADSGMVFIQTDGVRRCMSRGTRSGDGTVGPIAAICSSSSATQKWDLNLDQQVVHRSTGTCLAYTGNVVLQTCLTGADGNTGAAQRWAWHPQQ